ncbi:S24 family peptidase [Sphingomonas nostoxanthinifaciens]|uniref:S24 family peptidase n=1 Tax=Sphingomonas nostoxanthinifaciens TaxID=2872652 RepID=UPI001CC21207|nr:S24 family peptidase [Sphingomonas nostoxanthinifaciens]UAK25848.1 hypothetical protein K8P63_06915 [Sphingomonas nostoxanthinifaciens]
MDYSSHRDMIGRLSERTGLSPTAIARKAGLSPSTLTRIAHGREGWSLKAPTMQALALTFPDFFELEKDEHLSAYAEVEVLPSYAGMGGGGFGDGEVKTALIPRNLIEERLRGTAADMLLIDVRGDSMTPDFYHGDQILVDRRDVNPAQPGPFALWDGETYVVKLIERLPSKRGWFRIFSANERYSPYEVREADIRIVGRPVWFGRAI